MSQANGTLSVVDPQPPAASADLLGDLLSPLAIEGPPGATVQSERNLVLASEGSPNADESLAIELVGEQTNAVQVQTSVVFSNSDVIRS